MRKRILWTAIEPDQAEDYVTTGVYEISLNLEDRKYIVTVRGEKVEATHQTYEDFDSGVVAFSHQVELLTQDQFKELM